MDDTVSRAAAIDAVSRGCQEFRGIFAECEKNLNALPAVQTCDDAVSRQAAIVKLQNNLAYMRAFGCDRSIVLINELPAVQPQITHCAECRHWKHSDVRKNYCEVFDWMNTAEDFCSFAERRTDGKST